jgi:hypothetical protein
MMRRLSFLFLIGFILAGACGILGALRGGPDPFANGVSDSTSKVKNAENAVGAPNGAYAEIDKGGNAQHLDLDMGEGEEGTGNLVLYYRVTKDTSIEVVFWGVNEKGEKNELDRDLVSLMADGESVLVKYEMIPDPYRYVRFMATDQPYRIDAVKVETFRPDSDGDGLRDVWEEKYGLDLLDRSDENGADGDPDGDLLNNLQEQGIGTDPKKMDTDGDSLPDKWEHDHALDPLSGDGDNGRDGDPDQDGLKNYEEFEANAHPQKTDTDEEGLNDAEEVHEYKTDPTKKDSDGDGLNDAREVEKGTEPNNKDTDNDGLPDGWEVNNKFDALNPDGENGAEGDPDEDGLKNIEEMEHKTDPRDADSDDDDLNDAEEINVRHSDPKKKDTDEDGLPDGWEVDNGFDLKDPEGDNGGKGDPDHDLVSNHKEFETGTNPNKRDTDSDGLPDGWEIDNCLDPLSGDGENGRNGDPDGDQVINLVEMGAGESPKADCP